MNQCDVFNGTPLIADQHKFKHSDNASFEHQLLPPQSFCVFPTTYSNKHDAHSLTPTNFGMSSSQVFSFSPQVNT